MQVRTLGIYRPLIHTCDYWKVALHRSVGDSGSICVVGNTRCRQEVRIAVSWAVAAGTLITMTLFQNALAFARRVIVKLDVMVHRVKLRR